MTKCVCVIRIFNFNESAYVSTSKTACLTIVIVHRVNWTDDSSSWYEPGQVAHLLHAFIAFHNTHTMSAIVFTLCYSVVHLQVLTYEIIKELS